MICRIHNFIFVLLLGNFLLESKCENVKKSIEDNPDEDLSYEKEETMAISGERESSNVTVCTRRKNGQMHEIRKASHNQFPFMVAIMSPANEYVCAGAIVSNGIVLTTAQCTESISYVLVNTTMDRKNNSISLHIIKSETFPTYSGIHSTKDVAIIYTEKYNNTIASKINVSNYTSSQTLNDVEAFGFGLNADVGYVKDLQYVGVESRATTDEKIKGFIDCIDTKVRTCFRDKGGPIIFNNELVGVVTTGQNDCTDEIMSTYAINKRLIEALPSYTFKSWLDEKITKNTEQAEERLEVYPKKPMLREASVHVMTSRGVLTNWNINYLLLVFSYIFA